MNKFIVYIFYFEIIKKKKKIFFFFNLKYTVYKYNINIKS